MNTSGGGDATPEESKAGDSGDAAMAAECEKADSPSSKTELKSACSSSANEAEIPLYLDSFDGFAELPVKGEESLEKLKADESLEVPVYPDSFDGLAELPVKCSEYQENLKAVGGDDDDSSQLGSPKLSRDSSNQMSTTDNASVETMILLPDEFENCEDILDDIERSISKIDSLKRNTCDNDEIELGSPKRTKTEDDTIWAQSPNEPLRLAASIRGLLRMRNNDKKEATLDEAKSEFDHAYAAYRAAVSADVARNNATDSKDKDSSVAQNVEKARPMSKRTDSYATVGEKILNIPRRGEEVVNSYHENKEIAGKFKGYLGAVTTTALQVARASLVQTLWDMIGAGAGDTGGAGVDAAGGEATAGAVADGAAKGSFAGAATAGEAEAGAGTVQDHPPNSTPPPLPSQGKKQKPNEQESQQSEPHP